VRPQQPVQDGIEQRLGIGRDPMQASGFQETLELLAVLAGRSPFGWRTVSVLAFNGAFPGFALGHEFVPVAGVGPRLFLMIRRCASEQARAATSIGQADKGRKQHNCDPWRSAPSLMSGRPGSLRVGPAERPCAGKCGAAERLGPLLCPTRLDRSAGLSSIN